MEKLIFDTGVREFKVNNNGVLRFNPGDPSVYSRFLSAADQICKVEEVLLKKSEALQTDDTKQLGPVVLQLMEDADKEVKKILAWMFGEENDFDQIFGGVNVMAVATNGERVLTNFLNAVAPILQEGAQKCAKEKAAELANAAKRNRQQRRAK